MHTQESLRPESADTGRIVLPHQTKVFERLLEIAKVTFSVQRNTLPLRLRSNCLLVAPTGSGKTFLVEAVATAMKVPFLNISVSEWILLGCTQRGAVATWPSLVKFLRKHKSADGIVICCDELDKLSAKRSQMWTDFQATEVYSLLDFRVPPTLADDNGDPLGESAIHDAQEALRTKTLLIGLGAFQQIWDNRARPRLGFNADAAGMDELPGLPALAQIIPRELANRFRSEVLILGPLSRIDYTRMLESSAAEVPLYLQARFLALGRERIDSALRDSQGPRFLEELLFDTLIAERRVSTAGLEPETSTGEKALKSKSPPRPEPHWAAG